MAERNGCRPRTLHERFDQKDIAVSAGGKIPQGRLGNNEENTLFDELPHANATGLKKFCPGTFTVFEVVRVIDNAPAVSVLVIDPYLQDV